MGALRSAGGRLKYGSKVLAPLLDWGRGENSGPAAGHCPECRSVCVRVEAQGIEPWSECGSRTASTCVGSASCFTPAPAPSRPGRVLAPEVSPHVAGRHAWPARIFDPTCRAPGGLSVPEVREASLAQLTQPAPGYRWRLVVSRWFSQGPGPGHAAIPSSNPSKPIAPGCVRMIHMNPDGDKPRPRTPSQTAFTKTRRKSESTKE